MILDAVLKFASYDTERRVMRCAFEIPQMHRVDREAFEKGIIYMTPLPRRNRESK